MRQRSETVGSVLRSIVTFTVFGIAFVTILGTLGIDLAPLVASAGVIGIAIAFGAQTLVRDFLTGMFMILEDQYGVGDVVDAGPANGTVEAVGLRTTRLRDVNGAVWHIRNGTITRIGNMSQGWARAVLDVPVDHRADIGHARRVIAAVADDVWRNSEVSADILAEPEVWGVEQLTADAVTMRLVVKTAPLRQWEVARVLRERLKVALDEAGIDFPQGAPAPAPPAAGPPAGRRLPRRQPRPARSPPPRPRPPAPQPPLSRARATETATETEPDGRLPASPGRTYRRLRPAASIAGFARHCDIAGFARASTIASRQNSHVQPSPARARVPAPSPEPPQAPLSPPRPAPRSPSSTPSAAKRPSAGW